MQNKFKSNDPSPSTKLPEEIQTALKAISHFGEGLKQLDQGSQQALGRIVNRYGEILEKFNSINSKQIGEQESKVALLQTIQLFQKLSTFDLSIIAEKMEKRQVLPGMNLLTQGEVSDGVYFIGEGDVEILVNQELVAHRGSGDSVGEMSCLRGEEVSATVRTLSPCKIFVIEREQFLKTIDKFPQLWRQLFSDVTDRFHELNKRTSEILQHSPQGLIKIDCNGTITNEFTSHCTEYLQSNDLEGKDFATILFPEDSPHLTGWKQVFPLFFEDVPMEFGEIADLLPRETLIQHSDGSERNFRLSYYPCGDPEEPLDSLDVGIEDITEEREAEKKNKALENEKLILQKIYDDPDSYLHTLNLLEEVLMGLQDLLLALKQASSTKASPKAMGNVFKERMRSLHTLKGMSGMMLLESLKRTVHQTEDYLGLIHSAEKVSDYHIEYMEEQYSQLAVEGDYAESFLKNMSDDLRTRLTGIVLSSEEFGFLKKSIELQCYADAQKLLGQIEKIPIRSIVKSWPEEIERLGKKLGKEVHFGIEGENLKAPRDLLQNLDTSLIHVLRNCVDHGLETPDDRLAAGKPEWGRITVNIENIDQGFLFEVSDDGRGLDLEKIAKRARENENLDQDTVETYISQNEIWRLLFLPGFSTMDKVTEISGRGVGLDAVHTAIDALHGTIRVLTQPGEGTLFSFSIPLDID